MMLAPQDSIPAALVESYFEPKSPLVRKLKGKYEGYQEKAENIKGLMQEKSEGYKELIQDKSEEYKDLIRDKTDRFNYNQGGEVMNYYGGGSVRDARTRYQGYQDGGVVEALEAFGGKSKSADDLSALAAIQMVGMQQGGMVPPPMPQQALPPAGFMQQGGEVRQPMPVGEAAGMEERPVPSGERAYPQEPEDQLGLKEHEYAAYVKHGPEAYKYLAQKFKPQTQWSVYDTMVDAGSLDPYEVNEDDFVVMTRDMVNKLREQ